MKRNLDHYQNMFYMYLISLMNIKVGRIRFYKPAHDSTLLLTPPNIFTTLHVQKHAAVPARTCWGLSRDTTRLPPPPPPVALNHTLNLVKRFPLVAGRSRARQAQRDV